MPDRKEGDRFEEEGKEARCGLEFGVFLNEGLIFLRPVGEGSFGPEDSDDGDEEEADQTFGVDRRVEEGEEMPSSVEKLGSEDE